MTVQCVLLYGIDMAQDWPLLVLAIGMLGLAIVLVVYNRRSNKKAERRIAQWATENGWRLLQFEPRLDTGPFKEWPSRGHAYYRFVVCDRQESKRIGWARFDITPFSAWAPEIKWPEKPEGESLNIKS